MAGSAEPERSSGRILALRARRTSTASSNGDAASSAISFLAASTACLKRAGCDAGQERGLDHDHFLELHALAQHLRVVDHEAGEIFVHQPDADEGVAFGQRDDRVEARLLEAGGVKQREVEAGADLAGQDVARTADHLAGALEALGRQDVGDRMRDQRGPDRVGDLPGAGLGALAVAVHGLVAAGGGELVGGFAQDDVDARIGRPNEGGKQLRRRIDAAPMRRRQQVDLDGMLGEHRRRRPRPGYVVRRGATALIPARNAGSSFRSRLRIWWTAWSAMRSMRQTPGVRNGGSAVRWTEISVRSRPSAFSIARSRMIGTAF